MAHCELMSKLVLIVQLRRAKCDYTSSFVSDSHVRMKGTIWLTIYIKMRDSDFSVQFMQKELLFTLKFMVIVAKITSHGRNHELLLAFSHRVRSLTFTVCSFVCLSV